MKWIKVASSAFILIFIYLLLSQFGQQKEDYNHNRIPSNDNFIDAQKKELWNFARNISIVYTWVNGSDPQYSSLRQQYGGNEAVGTSRDRDNDELKHSLRSIEKYMKWHKGTIFIVTPGQVPNWLNVKHPRIKVINQDSLFPNSQDTPNFNTNAIEQHLWRIPGLTDIFIHMNDDYLIMKNLSPAILLTDDKQPRLYFEKGHIRGGKPEHDLFLNDGNKLWLASTFMTADLLRNSYGREIELFFLKHAPFVYHKKVFELIHTKWQKELEETSACKFRHWDNYITPLLHHYFLIYEGENHGLSFEVADQGDLKSNALLVVAKDDKEKLKVQLNDVLSHRPHFFALNDDFQDPSVSIVIKDFLQTTFSNHSSFEMF